MTIRGHFYAHTTPALRFRNGQIVKEKTTHWYAAVLQGNAVLWQDDCRDRDRLVPDLTENLAAFRRCAELGQIFEPWSDIVDRAAEEL